MIVGGGFGGVRTALKLAKNPRNEVTLISDREEFQYYPALYSSATGHSRLELSRFLTPPVVADHRNAPVNALGYLRVMFAVDDLDDVLARLRTRGAQLVGDVVQYADSYRLCYIRGPEGLLIGLAEQLA